MRLHALAALFLLCCSLLPAQSQCILSGTPRLIRAEGLAEPLGDVQLQCWGGAPAQAVSGVLQITLDSRIGNRLNGGILQDVSLSIQNGAGWQPLPSPARSSGNAAVFESLNFAYNPQGQLALKISGLRAQGQSEVRAFLSFLATPALPIPTPVVVVGRGETSLLTGFVNPSFSTLTARVTENVASAFGGPGDLGARVLVRFHNVPEGGSVIVPDAVAGSSAVTPTSAGAMSLPGASGVWQSGSNTLLLIRMDGADSNGAGGSPAFTPQSGLNSLEGSGLASSGKDGPYAVYEVVAADPARLEFAEIPAHLSVPKGWQGRAGVVRPTAQLAPLSAAPGPSETLPVPRFSSAAAKRDCDRLSDCRAPYFPRVVSFLNGETPSSWQMPAESQSRNQFIAVRNDFGGLAEWRVKTRYTSGNGWLKLHNTEGINNSTVAWFYDTRALSPGRYEAELVVEITNGPQGLPNEQTIPLALTVTAAVEPPKPPVVDPPKPELPKPVITDVVNGASLIAGPVAPGSLLLIRGTSFTGEATVRLDGQLAAVVRQSPTEIVVETPASLAAPKYVGLVVEQAGLTSGVWGIDTAPVAPAILMADNGDGQRNSQESPAAAGAPMRLFVTGVRFASTLSIKIHDRVTGEIRRVEQDPPLPGLDILQFTVPGDLPAMSTAVVVCAGANSETAPLCAEPLEVFLRRPPAGQP